MSKAKRAFEAKVADATGSDIERRNKLLKYTRSQVNKTFGANNEAAFIKDFEFKTQIQVNRKGAKEGGGGRRGTVSSRTNRKITCFCAAACCLFVCC